MLQDLVLSHFVGHTLPPQSTSVSDPSFWLLEQVLGELAQVLPWQYPPWQSVLELHCLPSWHFSQFPPQSMSVSDPSFWLLLHVSWQTPFEQTSLAQSVLAEQLLPLSQGLQVPPQSTSVSSPSF